MTCSKSGHWLCNTVLLLNRLSLGMFFLLAGVAKVRGGVTEFVEGFYSQVTPAWLPSWIATPFGYSLPFFEIIAGGLLVIGLFGRLGALVILLLLVSFTIALCGAGMFFSGPGPFHTNVILLTLAALLVVTGSGGYSLDAKRCCNSCSAGSCCPPTTEPPTQGS